MFTLRIGIYGSGQCAIQPLVCALIKRLVFDNDWLSHRCPFSFCKCFFSNHCFVRDLISASNKLETTVKIYALYWSQTYKIRGARNLYQAGWHGIENAEPSQPCCQTWPELWQAGRPQGAKEAGGLAAAQRGVSDKFKGSKGQRQRGISIIRVLARDTETGW